MRKIKIILFVFSLLLFAGLVSGQMSMRTRKNMEQSYEDNANCLRCHANEKIKNDSQRIVMKHQNILDSNLYYSSIHGGFRCIDCHSEDFSTYPHTVTVKDDYFPACLDCHEGNKKTAGYHFEKISEAYLESVHAKKLKDEFNCWKCHDPHSYTIYYSIADSIGLSKMIFAENNMCIKCHGDSAKSGSKKTIAEIHNWLPNQELHFRHVRCIDCHAVVPDSINVSHNIMPASIAIRNCLACHQINSRLLSTLYKYNQSVAKQRGIFYNSEILQNSYVMGANRNYLLNFLSIAFFGLALAGVLIHSAIRIISKKKKNG